MSAQHKQSVQKAEREAAKRERAFERERRQRTSRDVTDAPEGVTPPQEPSKPRQER